MHQEKISVLFVINLSRTNKKGSSPLYCRVTLNGKRKQFSTGLFVYQSYWESQHQKVNTKESNHKYINAQIERIQVKIYNIALVFQLQGMEYSLAVSYTHLRAHET